MNLKYSVPRRGAFTLIELLVVVGIIALLISVLLPTLAVARQGANRTLCAAKLQQIMTAAQNHRATHRDYYPLAGRLPAGVGFEPNPAYKDLADHEWSRYDYFSYAIAGNSKLLAPVTIGLAQQMGYKNALFATSNEDVGAVETDNSGFIRNFLCPAHTASTSEIKMTVLYAFQYQFYSVAYTQQQSYTFNEAVLGFSDDFGRLRGNAVRVRMPDRTVFCADGFGESIYNGRGGFTGLGVSTFYNKTSQGPITLGDALVGNGLAGDPDCFDHRRHNGRINVAFCDGHVENRNCGDGTSVESQAHAVTELSNVYLLAP